MRAPLHPLVSMLRDDHYRRFPDGITRTNRGGAWHSRDLSPDELERAITACAQPHWPTENLTPIRGWFMAFPRGSETTRHTHPEADLVTVDGIFGRGSIELGYGIVTIEPNQRIAFRGSAQHRAIQSPYLWAVLVVNWRKKQ